MAGSSTAGAGSVLRVLGTLYPWEVAAGEDVSRSLAYLGVDASPGLVVSAGYGLALVSGPLVAAGTALAGVPTMAALPVALAVSLGVATAGHTIP